MAGIIPPFYRGQFSDLNGRPLVGAQLTVYLGGTLQKAQLYQDFGLTVPLVQNPITTDQTGRFPPFFVADLIYFCVMNDASGRSVLSDTLPSIGPSGGGGGGGGVDPTTIFATGMMTWRPLGGVLAGWVRANALTIGSATSGASERANNDCQNLFLFLWNSYPNSKCPVVGGRGVSAAADWAANKQLGLLDMRGRAPVGKDGMGNGRAGVLPDSNVSSGGGDTGDTDAASGGSANNAIGQANLPNVNFNISGITLNNGIVTAQANQNASGAGGSVNALVIGTAVTINENLANVNFVGVSNVTVTSQGVAASGGAGAALPTEPPFSLGTWYIKL